MSMVCRPVLLIALALLGGLTKPSPSLRRGALNGKPQSKWVYLATNLLVDANVDSSLEMLTKAGKLGYNGVMVADSKFCRWGDLPARYEANCARFREAVRSLGMKFVACVAPIGYSNDLLGKDPNLAEGLPVVDAPFKVRRNGAVVPVESPLLANGGFEATRGSEPAGWIG